MAYFYETVYVRKYVVSKTTRSYTKRYFFAGNKLRRVLWHKRPINYRTRDCSLIQQIYAATKDQDRNVTKNLIILVSKHFFEQSFAYGMFFYILRKIQGPENKLEEKTQ